MSPNIPKPITFVRPQSQRSRLLKLYVVAMVCLMFVTVAWIFKWDAFGTDQAKSSRLMDVQMWMMLVTLIVMTGFALLGNRLYKNAQLILDAEGAWIKMRPDGSNSGLFGEPRKLKWAGVKSIVYLPAYGLVQLRPKSLLGNGLPIRVKEWRLEGADSAVRAPGAPLPEPDVLRVMRELGLLEAKTVAANTEAIDFDLFGHPVTRAFTLAALAVVLSIVADSALQDESWAFFEFDYYFPHIVVGVLAVPLIGLLLMAIPAERKLPSQIVWGLAFFGGLVMGTASYVEGIRINQLVGGPLVAQEYHRSGTCESLIPVDPLLPVIEYTHLASDYWCGVPASQVVTVRVRKGLFGLYQVDLSEHTKAIREYRQTH